ncbi:hypothetical protein H2280_08250, partial [Campylobacter sp. 2457A]|nr:hypothetical protein [Campylobacter sp. 2457A]
TCADATITGCELSGNCGTISEEKQGTITITDSNNISLTIEASGSVKPNDSSVAINFSNDSSIQTFKNQGTVVGGNDKASIVIGNSKDNGATITNFENSGTIGNGSSKFGVVIWAKDDNAKSTIENFTNDGAISSNDGESIFIKNTTIENFTNSGTISSTQGQGINISNDATIETFTNNGIISSDNNNGIKLGYTGNSKKPTIKNFTNTGTIKSNSTKDLPQAGQTANAIGAVKIEYGDIETINNSGTVSGILGFNIMASTIDNFTNTGTIEGTSHHKYAGAFILTDSDNRTATIRNFTNEGLIKANNTNGIVIGIGNKIETLTNNGTIEAGLDGISFTPVGNKSPNIDLGQINLESGSIIKAGRDGIHVAGTNGGIKAKGIEVKKGAKVEGGNAGIFIGGGKQLDTLIKISGEVKGGKAGIINEGVIGSGSDNEDTGIKIEEGGSLAGGIVNQGNGSITGSITVEEGGQLDSIVNTSTSDTGISGSITNNSNNKLEISNGEGATIGGGIVNNGSADLVISNQGNVGKDKDGNTVTNNGQGSVNI